jgi:hypothetical protein
VVEKVDFKKDLRELILGVLERLMFFAFPSRVACYNAIEESDGRFQIFKE